MNNTKLLHEYEFVCISFLCVGVDKFIEYFADYISLASIKRWDFEESSINLKEICFPSPLYGGVEPSKFLAWEPNSVPGSTIFFSNRSDGLLGFIKSFSGCYSIKSYSFRFSNCKDKMPCYSMDVYDEGDLIRHVSLIKEDDSWVFYQEGQDLSFELTTNYMKKDRDRLDRKVIINYIKEVGWNLDNEDTWKSDRNSFKGNELRPPVKVK